MQENKAQTTYVRVDGMFCEHCVETVSAVLEKLPGVTSCAVSLLTNSMSVEGSAGREDIISAVEKAGYGASVTGTSEKKNSTLVQASELLRDTLVLSVFFDCDLSSHAGGHGFEPHPFHRGRAIDRWLFLFVRIGRAVFCLSVRFRIKKNVVDSYYTEPEK